MNYEDLDVGIEDVVFNLYKVNNQNIYILTNDSTGISGDQKSLRTYLSNRRGYIPAYLETYDKKKIRIVARFDFCIDSIVFIGVPYAS